MSSSPKSNGRVGARRRPLSSLLQIDRPRRRRRCRRRALDQRSSTSVTSASPVGAGPRLRRRPACRRGDEPWRQVADRLRRRCRRRHRRRRGRGPGRPRRWSGQDENADLVNQMARHVGTFRRADRRLPLLDRDGLREVARLVDVEAVEPGDVVGEQLQRQDRQQRLQDPVGARARRSSRRRPSATRSSPSVATAIVSAPRARTSSMLESILSRTGLSVATQTTGVDSSSRAIGPCFISPAA